jgi:hypothetical protein
LHPDMVIRLASDRNHPPDAWASTLPPDRRRPRRRWRTKCITGRSASAAGDQVGDGLDLRGAAQIGRRAGAFQSSVPRIFRPPCGRQSE